MSDASIPSVTHLLLATAEQSRHADRYTMEQLDLSGDTLMEIAGNGAADKLADHLPPASRILLVCGKGNNAGDALVAGRILMDKGHRIMIYPVMGHGGFTAETQKNYDRLLSLAGKTGHEVPVWSDWPDDTSMQALPDVIIDGIFGTGLKREVSGPAGAVIRRINATGLPVCSMDIPSGLNCDTGEIMGSAVRARWTVQFGLRKLGCYLGEGPNHSGERSLVPLPFPSAATASIGVRLVDEQRELLPYLRQHRRTAALHKYSNGVVYVIGGSAGLSGAPLYAARAAWSLGMGAVFLVHPSGHHSSPGTAAPELIKIPVGSPDSTCFTENDAEFILEMIQERPGVVILGPGSGRDPRTMNFVRRVIAGTQSPLVVDADGLRAITGNDNPFKNRQGDAPAVLTPHPGELSAMMDNLHGTGSGLNQPGDRQTDSNRFHAAIELAGTYGATVVSKGSPVIITGGGTNRSLLTGYDTTLFCRAGFGDVLSGHIAAFLARGCNGLMSAENGLLTGCNRMKQAIKQGRDFPEPSDLI